MPPLFLDDMGVDGPPQFLSDPVLDGIVGSLTYRYLGEFGGEHRFINDTQGFNLFVDDPFDLPGQTLFVDPLLPGLHPGNPKGWLTPLTGHAPLLLLDPLAPIPLQVPILDPLGDPLGSNFMQLMLPPLEAPGLELSLQAVLLGDLVQATQNFTQPGQVQMQPFLTFTQPLGIGQHYCDPAPPNSTGQPGVLFATGSPVVQDDFMQLHSVDLPPQAAGFILASPGEVFVPNPGGSQGELCVGPAIGRGVGGVIFNTGPLGQATVLADLLEIPTPNGPVPMQPGIHWNFQTWYRDSSPSGATSNLTNALRVVFQ